MNTSLPTSSLSDSSLIAPVVWTIAASDSSGGAGIQADLTTFFDLGVRGCSAITAITAQNSQGVHHIDAVSPVMLQQQLTALSQDGMPQAIKIGVLPLVESIECVLAALALLAESARRPCPVILDTVLSPTSGESFSSHETRQALLSLLPYVDLLTPNIPEAEALTGLTITDTATQLMAAQQLVDLGATAVLVKGGHGDTAFCQDVFYSTALDEPPVFWLTQSKQETMHTHGTGCTLSSAIAAFIAHQKSVRDAVVLGNAYVNKGIRLATSLDPQGQKKGAVAHTGWPSHFSDFPQVSVLPEAINHMALPVCDTHQLGLYPVVDSIEWLERLLVLGVKTIQLRVKDIPEAKLAPMIEQAAQLGHRYDARLFINDYWQLAIRYNAYGVHLGQEDMIDADVDAIRNAGLHLGISTHGEYELSYAATFKPSYLAIGAVFPTDTKEVIEVGIDNLYGWTRIMSGYYPLVAIGGINQSNIESVLGSGVGSVAVVSAITKADDYQQSVSELTTLIQRYQ